MFKHLVNLLILSIGLVGFSNSVSVIAAPEICEADARSYIQVLTGKEFAGRRTGTAGIELAAKYLEQRLSALQMPTLLNNTYRQTFTLPQSKPDTPAVEATNLVCYLPGTDPVLKDQYIVVGAHYDHLGQKKDSDQYFPGANDNASGVAALLEVAEYLKHNPVNKRSIIFGFFTAEEIGLHGSRYFIEHPPVPREQIVAMINLDMVGGMKNNQLIALATGSSPVWKPAIKAASTRLGLSCPEVPVNISGSDHVSFYQHQIPVVFFITGGEKEMHTIDDTIDKINFDGLVLAARMVVETITELDKVNQKFEFTPVSQPKANSNNGNGKAVKLGIIPDFAITEGLGVAEVFPESVAEATGILKGDIIIKWNDIEIKNIQDYTAQVKQTKPGDKVIITIKRGEKVLVLEAQF